jgi:hypothetical protein
MGCPRYTGPFDTDWGAVAHRPVAGAKRTCSLPRVGHRSGKVTILGYRMGPRGGVLALVVGCDCGCGPYLLQSTSPLGRCRCCARTAAAETRKGYWGYADIVPDDAHRTRLLNRISAIHQRCGNPNDRNYHHYGGRGIRCAWGSDTAGRRSFLSYLVMLPGWDKSGLDLDRADVDGGYEPGNLRFVSRSENARNRRSVRNLEDRIRHLERRIAEQVYDPDDGGAADCP